MFKEVENVRNQITPRRMVGFAVQLRPRHRAFSLRQCRAAYLAWRLARARDGHAERGGPCRATGTRRFFRAKERLGSVVMPQIFTIIIKGGIVMIPLLACSLISLALSIERILFWTRLKSKVVINEILALVEKGDYEQALKLGKNSPQPIARVLAAGIAHRNPAPAKAMEAAAQAEIPVLKSRLGILDTIVTLAPLLGLLGTVVGMIGSFDVMADVGIGQPHAVTGGVAGAVIGTANR